MAIEAASWIKRGSSAPLYDIKAGSSYAGAVIRSSAGSSTGSPAALPGLLPGTHCAPSGGASAARRPTHPMAAAEPRADTLLACYRLRQARNSGTCSTLLRRRATIGSGPASTRRSTIRRADFPKRRSLPATASACTWANRSWRRATPTASGIAGSKPGDIDVVPTGFSAAWHDAGPTSVLVIDIDPALVRTGAQGLGLGADQVSIKPQLQLKDPRLEHILWALKTELESEDSLGRRYADSLGIASVAHLLRRFAQSAPRHMSLKNAPPQ